MVYEKIYELEDGNRLVLLERESINDVNYLLLNQKGTDNFCIAYEDSGDLIFIKDDTELYDNILSLLFNKFEKKCEVDI